MLTDGEAEGNRNNKRSNICFMLNDLKMLNAPKEAEESN